MQAISTRSSRSQSVIETSASNGDISAAVPNPNHLDTIQPNTLPHSASNSNLRPHTYHGRLNQAAQSSNMQATNWSAQPTQADSLETIPIPAQLDLAKTDDVALLKQEILSLRRKAAIYREERDSLAAILGIEKDFVRDRQNKLDSWEHFARLIVFKVY
jgi:hypothetical protein